MRVIFLSPHLDDATLSAGGMIRELAAHGRQVEIWTLMAGMPGNMELSAFAAEMHGKWGTTTVEHTLQVRKAEDLMAAARLQAKAIHLGFLDAIYRRGPDGQPLYAEPVGTAMHPEDSALPMQIARELSTRLEEHDTLICPLAIGAHVDHVIVRQAAEILDRPLNYCADVPYTLFRPEERVLATSGMGSRLYPVSESGFGDWLEAIKSYTSQLSTLYESWELFQQALRAYWCAERGLRLWTRGSLPPVPGLDSAHKT